MGRPSLSNEEFDSKMKLLKGNEYIRIDNYINYNKQITFKHNKCNTYFKAAPSSILKRETLCCCKKCKKENKFIRDTETFKKDIYKLTGDNYELLSDYKGVHNYVKMKCNKCGNIWNIKSNNFYLGKRCPVCRKLKKKTIQDIQIFLDENYPNEFKVIGKYKNKDTPLEILHLNCNHIITPTWNNIRGNKFCSMSSGELRVSKILESLGIKYDYQVLFEECKDEKCLPFDFYFEINKKSYIIEYDGRQHFMPIFGHNNEERNEHLNYSKKHDKIKNKFCNEYDINLLRINYSEKDIEKCIKDFIK